jgi:hypothetical protein
LQFASDISLLFQIPLSKAEMQTGQIKRAIRTPLEGKETESSDKGHSIQHVRVNHFALWEKIRELGGRQEKI